MTEQQNAFAGLKVLEIGDFIPGPWCGRVLASLGCQVTKVEPPEGDSARRYGPFPADREDDPEASGMFAYLNQGKRGVTLDLDDETGRAHLDRLLVDADILVVDLPVAEQERRGLTYDALKAVNPNLIVTSISPFGLSGPFKDRRAYDITIAAAAGVAVGVGMENRSPLTFPLFQVLFQGGSAAAAATLVALLARQQSNEGQQVEVAIEEVVATQHTGRALPTFIYRGITGKRAGAAAAYFGAYPQGVYECKDGYVSLGAPQLDQWIRFIEVMGKPEWSKEPRYRDRRAMLAQYKDEVDALIAPWLMAHTRHEIMEICLEHRIPFAPLFTGSELLAMEQFKSRDFFTDISREAEGWLAPRGQFRMFGLPQPRWTPAPRLGEHNATVLTEG